MSGTLRKIAHRSEHRKAMERECHSDAPTYYTTHPWPVTVPGQMLLAAMTAEGATLRRIAVTHFRVEDE